MASKNTSSNSRQAVQRSNSDSARWIAGLLLLFIGLFARFSFVMPGSPIGFQLVGYLAIILGALGWWFSITYFVNKVRSRFNLRGIWVLNRIIGVVVMIAAVVGIVLAIAGKSFS